MEGRKQQVQISTLGRSPKTTTEMAWALKELRDTEVSRVVFLSTSEAVPVPEEIRRELPWIRDWDDSRAVGFADVETDEQCDLFFREAYSCIVEEKGRGATLHLDLTGGRKTMSAYLMLAGQLACGDEDRMYHVLAKTDMLLKPYKKGDPPLPADWIPSRKSDIRLVDVPFSRMREIFSGTGALAEKPGLELVDKATDRVRNLVYAGFLAAGARHEASRDFEALFGFAAAAGEAGIPVRRHAESIRRLYDFFLSMAKGDGDTATVEFAGVLDRLAGYAREKGVEFVETAGLRDVGRVAAHAEIVLKNLVRNSVQARATKVTISRAGARGVAHDILVMDNGPGMNAETAPRAFELGFTTKRGGSGAGLPLARFLASQCGGELELVHTEPGKGVVFRFVMPEA